jgi:8-oxo-dGTP diphosphatase
MVNEAGRHIHVTCAIIERDGLVLAAQRSETMSHPLKWEFPGGKIRLGESGQECLVREIDEEMGVKVAVIRALQPSTHRYPSVKVTLYPFVCGLGKEEPVPLEHFALRWLPPQELHTLDWAEADLPVLAQYCRLVRVSGTPFSSAQASLHSRQL